MTLAEKIKHIRMLKGFVQEDMAKFMGVTTAAVSEIERGANKSISMGAISSLVKAGINPYYILTDDSREPVFAHRDAGMVKKIKKYEQLIDKLSDLKNNG